MGSVWYSSLQNLRGTNEEEPYPATCVLTLLQVRVRLYCAKAISLLDLLESNLMFILLSDKDQRKNKIAFQ